MAKQGVKLAVSTGIIVMCLAPATLAQDKKKPMDDDDVVFDNTKPKKKANDEPEVVFDNTATETKEPEKLENATTFATTDPDAPEERRRRYRPGFAAGFRLGFSFPGGKHENNSVLPISAGVSGIITVGVDAGYRFTENLYVVLNVGAGYVLANNCSGGASCSGWQFRGGPMGMWRFLPFENISPWVGLGAGYEYMVQSATVGGSSFSSAYHGFQFVEVSGGAHFRTSRTYAGPFVSLAMGQYSKNSTSGTIAGVDSDDSRSIDDPATHRWLTFGLHAVLD